MDAILPEHLIASGSGLNTGLPVKKFTRQKTGCFSCRRRKKKCTEDKPQCKACLLTGIDCVYPDGTATPQRVQMAEALHASGASRSLAAVTGGSDGVQSVFGSLNDGLAQFRCESCSSQKKKCDRVIPTCGRCQKVDRACVYIPASARHRAPPKFKSSPTTGATPIPDDSDINEHADSDDEADGLLHLSPVHLPYNHISAADPEQHPHSPQILQQQHQQAQYINIPIDPLLRFSPPPHTFSSPINPLFPPPPPNSTIHPTTPVPTLSSIISAVFPSPTLVTAEPLAEEREDYGDSSPEHHQGRDDGYDSMPEDDIDVFPSALNGDKLEGDEDGRDSDGEAPPDSEGDKYEPLPPDQQPSTSERDHLSSSPIPDEEDEDGYLPLMMKYDGRPHQRILSPVPSLEAPSTAIASLLAIQTALPATVNGK